MSKGFDANRVLSKFGNCLKETGYDFVCRYYNHNNPEKNLTFSEAAILSTIGLKIVAVWENGYPTDKSYFSYAKGIADGTAAYIYARETINQPSGTPIYFAVDYDALKLDIDGIIMDYFKGINDSFNQISENNPFYSIGVYGSGLVCKSLLYKNKVTYTWLAQSSGWSGYDTFKSYNIKQLKGKTECLELGSVKGDRNISPKNGEGSFIITDLIDHIVRKKLFNEVKPYRIRKKGDDKNSGTQLALDQIQAIVSQNNNSPFSDDLIIAVCWTESSFIPTAKNPSSSATGLMMMTKDAIDTVNRNTPLGTHFEHKDMTVADKAIAAGSWYLKIIYEHNGGKDKKKTLKSYGDGTDLYATNIMDCEKCMTKVGSDKKACLKEIHP